MKVYKIFFLFSLILYTLAISNISAQKSVPNTLSISENYRGVSKTLHATKTITADNSITGGSVSYIAGKIIVLEPGFNVTNSAFFVAEIGARDETSINHLSGTSNPDQKIDQASIISSPNPTIANATITYSLVETAKVSVTLFDIKGMEVVKLVDDKIVEAGLHKENIDLKNLSPGVYTCILNTGTEKVSHKIIKQ